MRKLQNLFTVLLVGLSFTYTSAQVQYNSAETARQNNTCTDPDDILTKSSFQVPVGDDVLLLVVASGQWRPSSVTYNSQTLTKLAEMHNKDASGWHVTVGMYYLKLGDVGSPITSDINVNWTGTSSCCFKSLAAMVFTNVDQTTPMNNQDSIHHPDNSTSLSLDITSVANDMVVDFLVGKRNTSITQFTPDASQTEMSDLKVKPTGAATNQVRIATSYELSTTTTTTMSWSTPNSNLITQLHVGANIQSAGVLPVELVNFTASDYEEQVVLNWQTASEKINEGFEIERSSDGNRWENIGFVAGNGTTTEVHDYTFSDDEPIIGQSYYRLKQIDYDGAFEYSDVLAVNYENGIQNVNITLFPNPVVNELQVKDGQGQATIYNSFGQRIKTFKIQNSPFKINTFDLPKGQYLLHIQQQNGNVITKQFIK
jgi:hypothetical protein